MKKRNFSESCYKLLCKVPKGKVTTYSEIAKALQSRAYRAVGNAMHNNKNAPVIPCHRVVRANGELGGYAFGIAKKIQLLKSEGVNIEENKVKDLKKYFYKFK
jgi:methylated-DNA-[protein]-cysteine S-methyltransferase